MKRAVSVLLLFSLVASTLILIQPAKASGDSWTSKASMQVARGGLGITVANNKIYAIGGSTLSGLYPPDILGGFIGTNEEYDPTTDTWTFKKSMSTPRSSFAICSYQNKIFCIGGAVGVNIDSNTHFSSYVTSGVNEVYDTATDTWETKKPMPVAEMRLQASVVNGKIYVIGAGFTYVYDPAVDSWTPKTPLPAKPPASSGSYAVSVVADNSIFVVGEFSTLFEPKTFIYDTKTSNWSQGKSAPLVIVNGAAGVTTGVKAPVRIYVFGVARGQLTPLPASQVYDPEADMWTTGASMPTNRMNHNAAVVNDMLYVIGGYNFSSPYSGYVTPTAANEQYTPIDYGSPDPFYPTPTPPSPSQSPTPSLSTSPTLTPIASPTQSPPLSASPSNNPTSTPNSSQNQPIPQEVIYGTVIVALVIVVAAGFALRKRRQQQRVR
jgi:hypothetical protein